MISPTREQMIDEAVKRVAKKGYPALFRASERDTSRLAWEMNQWPRGKYFRRHYDRIRSEFKKIAREAGKTQ